MKAILFDFGNTLVRHDNLDWSKLEKAGLLNHIDLFSKRHIKNISITKWSRSFYEQYEQHKKIADKNLIEIDIERIFYYLAAEYSLPKDISPELLTRLFYLPICRSRLLFDDVISALNAITRKNIRIGLLSNTNIPGVLVNEVLERLQILQFFSFTLYSSDIGYRKPHSLAFQLAVMMSGIKPSQVMMVGDRPDDDIRGALESGLKAVLINRKSSSSQKKTGKSFSVISSLSELPPMID